MFNDKKEKEKTLSKSEQIDKMVQMYKELEKQNKELKKILEESQKSERQKQREMVMNQDRH
jgi:flagellar motility protein MotE (MotC chaperone)